MKVRWTEPAARDLAEAVAFIAAQYPEVLARFERRLRATEDRLAAWPESARMVEGRPGVRVVPLIRFPYRVFYQVTPEAVDILHIRPARRRDPG